MRILVTGNTLQRDNLNPPDGQEADIVFWKRVKAQGQATVDGGATPFQILLDVRARLMQVRTDPPHGISAVDIGRAIVDEMASFTLQPTSTNFVEKAGTRKAAEWIVRDAEHASGLLHRLREGKEFESKVKPRLAAGLGAVHDALIESVNENLLAMHAWRKNRNSPGLNPMMAPFDAFTWQTIRGHLQELSDDTALQLRFARFFGYVETFRQAPISTYNREPEPAPMKPGEYRISPVTPVTALNRIYEPATQLGYKLLAEFGKQFELPHYLRE